MCLNDFFQSRAVQTHKAIWYSRDIALLLVKSKDKWVLALKGKQTIQSAILQVPSITENDKKEYEYVKLVMLSFSG